MLARRLPFEEIGGNDLRVLWAIHTDQRPPLIKVRPKNNYRHKKYMTILYNALEQGCPPVVETLMTKCWDKAISVRPSMDEVVSQMSLLAQFFPGSSEPIKFLEIGITYILRKASTQKFFVIPLSSYFW